MHICTSAVAAARAPWLPFAPTARPFAARLSAARHHCSMRQGGDDPSSSAGGGHQQHGSGGGGGGTGGGGGKHKRHKNQHKPSARPAAVAAPAADLPLPEGGTHIDGSLLEGGGQILRNASVSDACLAGRWAGWVIPRLACASSLLLRWHSVVSYQSQLLFGACRRWRPSWASRSKSTKSGRGATSRVCLARLAWEP